MDLPSKATTRTDRPLPVVAVNIKDSVFGRVFTMIHELTHILLNTGGICDLEEETETEQEALEIFCNHVAGAVIAPSDVLLSSPMVAGAHEPRPWPDEVIKQLSGNLNASRETVLRRLLILNLTPPVHYREKRRQFAVEHAERVAAQPAGFAPHHRVQLSGAGPLFTQLLLEAFNRERITASDVSDFLSIQVKHLAEIERDLLQQSGGVGPSLNAPGTARCARDARAPRPTLKTFIQGDESPGFMNAVVINKLFGQGFLTHDARLINDPSHEVHPVESLWQIHKLLCQLGLIIIWVHCFGTII
ncbi:MAG: ImmA/IrrE family metallo-endopeptidase [Acidobacteriota bacterium]